MAEEIDEPILPEEEEHGPEMDSLLAETDKEVALLKDSGKLTPQQAFFVYQNDPTEKSFGSVLKSLDPIINKSLAALGQTDNTLLRGQAKLFTAQAIKKYDPVHGAGLHTWVTRQLMQLRRANRNFNSPIKVPERTQLDAYYLSSKEQEFMETHGREPDVHELADLTKLPVKRIEKVRQQFYKVPSSSAIPDEALVGSETDFMHEAVSYLFPEEDYINRKILEHRTGYGGAQMLGTSELAAKLGVRPDVISKRSSRLADKLVQIEDVLRNTHG